MLLSPNPAALLGRSPAHWEDPGFCWHHAGPDDGTLSCRIFSQICSSPSLSPSCSRHASHTVCRWTQPSTWTSSSTSEVVPEWVGLLSSCLHLHPPLRWCLAQVHTGELSPVTFFFLFFFFSHSSCSLHYLILCSFSDYIGLYLHLIMILTKVNSITNCSRCQVCKHAGHTVVPPLDMKLGAVMMCCCWPIGSAVLTAGLQEARQGGVTPAEQTIGRTGSIKPPQDGAMKPEVCFHACLENKTLLLHSFTQISCRLTRLLPKYNRNSLLNGNNYIYLFGCHKKFSPSYLWRHRNFGKPAKQWLLMIVLKSTVCAVANLVWHKVDTTCK